MWLLSDGCVFLTQIGIHDKEVEVLLQVTAVFRNLSSEQVEYGSQQVVAQAEVITALMYERGEKQDKHSSYKAAS